MVFNSVFGRVYLHTIVAINLQNPSTFTFCKMLGTFPHYYHMLLHFIYVINLSELFDSSGYRVSAKSYHWKANSKEPD